MDEMRNVTETRWRKLKLPGAPSPMLARDGWQYIDGSAPGWLGVVVTNEEGAGLNYRPAYETTYFVPAGSVQWLAEIDES